MVESMADRISALVERSVTTAGAELVDVEYRKEDGDQILRIFIDRLSGVDLDLCARVNRSVKIIIDQDDIFYDHIEVSSPGLDRLLKTERDFLRFAGEKVKVKVKKEYPGRKKIFGILDGFDDHFMKVLDEDTLVKIPRELILSVRLDPEF